MSVKDWNKLIKRTVLFRGDPSKKIIIFKDKTSIIVEKISKFSFEK